MTVNESLWAMCPECGGNGCGKCQDGKIVVKAEGDMLLEICPSCGMEHGGCFVTPERPGPRMNVDGRDCLWKCGGRTKWYTVEEAESVFAQSSE